MGHTDDIVVNMIYGVQIPNEKVIEMVYSLNAGPECPEGTDPGRISESSQKDTEETIRERDTERESEASMIRAVLFKGSSIRNIPGTPYYFLQNITTPQDIYDPDYEYHDVFIVLDHTSFSVVPFERPVKVSAPSKEEKASFKAWLQARGITYEYGKYMAVTCI